MIRREIGWVGGRPGRVHLSRRMLGACVVVAASLAACVGCAPETHSGPREKLCSGSGCSEECRGLRIELCDVEDRDCQEAIFKSVRCVRGSSLSELPRTSFVPQSHFVNPDAAVDAGPGEEAGALPEPVLTDQEVAQQVWSRYLDDGLQALHLINAPLAIARANEGSNTGGISKNGQVALAEESTEQQWWSMRLLAHEYVHTMQERDYGGIGSLYGRYARSSVTSQGIQAYIEGEAELYAWLTHAFMRSTAIDDWALSEFLALDEKTLRGQVAASPSPWTTARQWQHYAVGARYLLGAWQRGGNLAVRSVMYNLEPDFGAWVSGFAQKSGARVSEAPVCNPDGNQLIVQDSLGPSGVFALLIAAARAQESEVIPSEPAWQLARELTEDQLRMYAPTLEGTQTQAQWLARDAQAAMCPFTDGEPRSTTSDAERLDAGLDAARFDSGRATSMSSCDAGAESPSQGSRMDAGKDFEVTEDTTFEELQMHLVPDAPVWVSWAFGFETSAAAKEFAAWIEATQWPSLRVERRAGTVTLRTRRLPLTANETAEFEAWTCR